MTSEITKAITQAERNALEQKPNIRGVQIGEALFPWGDHQGKVTVYLGSKGGRTTIVDGRTPPPIYSRSRN